MKIGETDPNGKLGTRDAIHVPVVTSKARYLTVPGDSVVFTDATLTEFREASGGYRHGILDPFLKEPVRSGDVCTILVDPEMQIHVRHHYDLDIGTSIPFTDHRAEEDDGCRGCY